ncbi:PREDICTED: probable transcription factor At1g61730 [Camelina sativa]|uniref:Probable transcription factor At1g61730 n=1 Tax=Camelina sativa TaxID=90675 RepID=A0ABM0WMU1_CAMSA|nr:PREDICTED: probable transcription factor At1g61730 [Camelina sativa]
MTKKLNPLEDPPSASSSDDDDIETSEAGEPSDDSSSSEDDESSKAPIKSLASAAAAASSKSTVVAESDSGSETETDSDSESTNPPNSGSGKTISVNLKKKEDPTSSAALALPAAKSGGTKRPASEAAAATASATANKRVKKVTSGGGEEESVKKPGFHRLWTEDDEIAVLQGMIDFKADTGKSPYEDSNGYYDFIKKDISFEVSKNQFMDKLRSLRKKYMGKEVKNGVEPSFAKPHDQKAYELAKIIWGPEGIATESNVKSNGVSKKSKAKTKLGSVKQELVYAGSSPNGKMDEDGDDDDDMDLVVHGGGGSRKSDLFESSSLVRMVAGCGVDEYYVKRQWSLLPVETKKVVEEKLKLLQAKELEFVMEKTDFLHEVTSMIVEASKNKKSH